jgi:hypothetical protein
MLSAVALPKKSNMPRAIITIGCKFAAMSNVEKGSSDKRVPIIQSQCPMSKKAQATQISANNPIPSRNGNVISVCTFVCDMCDTWMNVRIAGFLDEISTTEVSRGSHKHIV